MTNTDVAAGSGSAPATTSAPAGATSMAPSSSTAPVFATSDARYIVMLEKIYLTSTEPDFSKHSNFCISGNPAGLGILCTYKYGSISMGLESYRYACNVKWLGLRGDDMQLIPESAFQELKPRDLKVAKSLLSSKFLQENHRAELTRMVQKGKRAEIEALYSHGFDFLGKYIARKIVQSDYI